MAGTFGPNATWQPPCTPNGALALLPTRGTSAQFASVLPILYGCHVSQEVCPYNIKFASGLPEGSPFAPREVVEGKDARTLARELLAMSQEEFATAFRRSPMKRAKLRGLKRNAAVVLGNVGHSKT